MVLEGKWPLIGNILLSFSKKINGHTNSYIVSGVLPEPTCLCKTSSRSVQVYQIIREQFTKDYHSIAQVSA